MTRLYTEEADLYDIAFSWDVGEEVEWLLERLGGPARGGVLEPACGSGRILEAFAERGIDVLGLDISPRMVALANERLEARGLAGSAIRADIVSFRLDRRFGGAVCPIDSLACLRDPADVARHLAAVAAHLDAPAKYLIQLELRDPADPWSGVAGSEWDATRGDVTLQVEWTVEEIDLSRGQEVQRSRIEIRSGPRRGEVFDEIHCMAAWTPERWTAVVAESPFTYAAIFDGDRDERRPLPVGSAGRLLWHELELAP